MGAPSFELLELNVTEKGKNFDRKRAERKTS